MPNDPCKVCEANLRKTTNRNHTWQSSMNRLDSGSSKPWRGFHLYTNLLLGTSFYFSWDISSHTHRLEHNLWFRLLKYLLTSLEIRKENQQNQGTKDDPNWSNIFRIMSDWTILKWRKSNRRITISRSIERTKKPNQ